MPALLPGAQCLMKLATNYNSQFSMEMFVITGNLIWIVSDLIVVVVVVFREAERLRPSPVLSQVVLHPSSTRPRRSKPPRSRPRL